MKHPTSRRKDPKSSTLEYEPRQQKMTGDQESNSCLLKNIVADIQNSVSPHVNSVQ